MADTLELLSGKVWAYKSPNDILVVLRDDGGAGVGAATVVATFIDPSFDEVYNKNTGLYETYDAPTASTGAYVLPFTEMLVGPYLDGVYKLSLSPISNVIAGLPGVVTFDRTFLMRVFASHDLETAELPVGITVQHAATSASLSASGDLVSESSEITLSDLGTVGGVLRLLATQAFCNQVIDDTTKTLKLYNSGGTDVVLTFNLQDAAGLASVREPFRKLRD